MRAVVAAGQINSARAVGDAVNKHKVLVVRMARGGLVLVDGQPQPTVQPTPVLRYRPCAEKHLVGHIKMPQRLMPSAVVAVVADEHQDGVVKLATTSKVVNDGSNQLIGSSKRAAGGSELAAAAIVADRVGFGQPDDGDWPLEIDQVPKSVRGIGVVEVLPGLVGSQEWQVSQQAAAPQRRSEVRHDRQNAGCPVCALPFEQGVQRNDRVGGRVFVSQADLQNFMATYNEAESGQ